jgi:hypothetical protein
MIGTFRSEATGSDHPLQKLQGQLAHDGLAGLLETIILEMSGAGEAVVPLAKRLYQETEGNPFFLMEIDQNAL